MNARKELDEIRKQFHPDEQMKKSEDFEKILKLFGLREKPDFSLEYPLGEKISRACKSNF